MSRNFSAKLFFVFKILHMQKTTRFSKWCLYKAKQKPAAKIQDHVFLLHWRPHAKIQLIWRKKKKATKVVTYPLLWLACSFITRLNVHNFNHCKYYSSVVFFGLLWTLWHLFSVTLHNFSQNTWLKFMWYVAP